MRFSIMVSPPLDPTRASFQTHLNYVKKLEQLLSQCSLSITPVDGVARNYRKIERFRKLEDVTITDGATNYMIFEFDSNELVIDSGDKVTIEVQVQFRALPAMYEGATIRGNASSTSIEAEGADDLKANQLSGAATGDVHTLRSSGVIPKSDNTSIKTQGRNDTVGIFTINFDLTAFRNDFYVAASATTSNATTDGGVKYTVNGPSGFIALTSGVLTSSADEKTSGVYVVREGETETFTLTVTVDTDTTGLYQVLLNSVYFTANSDGASNVVTYTATPASQYRTGYLNINAN